MPGPPDGGVRIKLEKAEDELQRYSPAAGLTFTSEKENVAEEKLRQLQEELPAPRLIASPANRDTRWHPSSPESLPEVLDSKTLGEYQGRLTDLRRQQAELTTSLTATHPKIRKSRPRSPPWRPPSKRNA